MSFELWTAPGGALISFTGHVEFRDMFIPHPDKDEWGMDTIDRLVRGPASRYRQFMDTLKQGAQFGALQPDSQLVSAGYNFQNFFLQTWRPYDSQCLPGVSLRYKGFKNGVLPDPLIENQRVELVSTINSGSNLNVTHNGKNISSATRTIRYIAPQTTYRYISVTEPTASRYATARGGAIQPVSSEITVNYSDGTSGILTGSAPAGVVSALSTAAYPFVIGPTAVKVFGTPYWECMEQVRLQYPGA